jgi:dihydroxyacetone kinase
MAGVSLTLMACDAERLVLLDAPTAAPAWTAFRADVSPGAGYPRPPLPLPAPVVELRARRAALLTGRPLARASPEGRLTETAVRAAAAALVASKARLNALDAKAGDGDCGETVAAAGAALLGTAEGAFASGGPADTLQALATVVRAAVGGSHGGFYSMGFAAAAAALPPSAASDVSTWARAASAGADAVARYGSATRPTQPGARTLLDALYPAVEALAAAARAGASGGDAAAAAAAAAAAGAEKTKGMAGTVGRASYLRGDALADADPGAVAVAVWLGALADTIGGQRDA